MAHIIEQKEIITKNQNPANQAAYHYPNLGKTWPLETPQVPVQQVACIGTFCPQPVAQVSPQQAAGGAFCPSQTVAFVPFNQNEPLANNDLLVAGNQQDAPYLGVSLSQMPDGLQVIEVSVNSPAEKYGMKPGDIVSSINENIIKDIADFDDVMSKIKPGKVIRVIIIRGESKRPLYIKTDVMQ